MSLRRLPLAALALALAQLGDPAILRVLGKTTAITLAIFLLGGVALYVGFETAIDSATSMVYRASLELHSTEASAAR